MGIGVAVILVLVAIGTAIGDTDPDESEAGAETTSTTAPWKPIQSEAAITLCQSGGSQPVPDAQPYVPGGDPDKVIFVEDTRDAGYQLLLFGSNGRTMLQAAAGERYTLVACVGLAAPLVEVKRCTGYERDAYVILKEGELVLTIYEASTGRVIATRGDLAEQQHCPQSIVVTDKANFNVLGPKIDDEVLVSTVAPIVTG